MLALDLRRLRRSRPDRVADDGRKHRLDLRVSARERVQPARSDSCDDEDGDEEPAHQGLLRPVAARCHSCSVITWEAGGTWTFTGTPNFTTSMVSRTRPNSSGLSFTEYTLEQR